MTSITWGAEIAEVYDETYDAMFQAPVLGPMIDLLAELAGDGPPGCRGPSASCTWWPTRS